MLLDSEARQDAATPNQGRLKDPMYYFASFVRVMNGQISQTNGMGYMFDNMSQNPLTAPSVFGFYMPGYRIPRTTLFGPEFQIYSATDSVVRGNILYQLLTNQLGSDMTVDLTPFQNAATNITQLIDLADTKLLYGRMPATMRQSLATALAAAYDNNQRVQTVVYLTALSGQYAVQY